MAGWLAAAFLVGLQAGGAPFELELPPGYRPFAAVPDAAGASWEAPADAGVARFALHHYLVETPGATAEGIAADHARRLWAPRLPALAGARLESWRGRLSGHAAAGNDLRYRRQGMDFLLLERILLLDPHLVVLTWEGPVEDATAARQSLESLQLPVAWRAAAGVEEDRSRGGSGAGPGAALPGTLEVQVDLTGVGERRLVVETRLRLDAATPAPPEGLRWRLPGGADGNASPSERKVPVGEDGSCHLRYELPLDDAGGEAGLLASAARFGLVLRPQALGALDPGWLALPAVPGGDLPEEPPAWSLEVRVPGSMRVLSWTAPAATTQEEETGILTFRFPELEAGRAWPFFLAGQFRPQGEELRLWLRNSARALHPEDTLRFLQRCEVALERWLPGLPGVAAGPRRWEVATFPGTGDRALPGLLVLDEGQGWLDEAVDAPWRDTVRACGLAQRVAAMAFAARRGRGSGAPFLEASLAEYGAGRVLEAAGLPELAAGLRASWRRAEETHGPLPAPLTLLPAADLSGGRRLLSRGALVWSWIERRAGRTALDRVLARAAGRAGSWDTEDLRAALEAETGRDWLEGFRRFVYGKELPPVAGPADPKD